MSGNSAEARRWLAQGEHELSAARYTAGGGFHAMACFQSQQAAEKFLKAFLISRGRRRILEHSITELVQRCAELEPDFAALREPARELDRFYIPTRYPDALPGGAPFEVFAADDSARGLEKAERIAAFVRTKIAPPATG